MCARPHCSTSIGCVVSVALECVWTVIGSAGTGPGRVSHFNVKRRISAPFRLFFQFIAAFTLKSACKLYCEDVLLTKVCICFEAQNIDQISF